MKRLHPTTGAILGTLALAALAGGCSRAQPANDAGAAAASNAPASVVATAAAAAPDAGAEASPAAGDPPATRLAAAPDPEPVAPAAAAPASDAAACGAVSNAAVEAALHLHVDTLKVSSASCDFTFKDSPTEVTVEYDAADGADKLHSLRTANAAVQTALGGIANAVASSGHDPSGAAEKSLADATAPPDLPSVGDDQYAFTTGPAAFLGVRKGDTYVEITALFLPQGLSTWPTAADLARRTFAAHP